jgi:serine/threonine protein phosphatase PrpC
VTVGQPCPHCAEPTGTTDQFCESCGADLRVRRDRTDRVEIDLGALAGVSDRGRVHVRNEDAMALGHGTALGQRTPGRSATRLAAVVCDGVSTVHSPELASRAAAESALDVLLSAGSVPDLPAEHLTRDAVAAAARAVAALSAPGTRDAPSCTLVSALVDRSDPDLPEITVAWVGDSRAYWLAGAGAAEPARLLTADHSWAAEMVAAGMLDVATAMADVRAHAITHWLGADGEPEPGVVTLRPAGPGVLLLCSDGLWNYLPDAEGLAAVAVPAVERRTGALDAAAALTAVALEGGGRDNITAVVIPITARSPS